MATMQFHGLLALVFNGTVPTPAEFSVGPPRSEWSAMNAGSDWSTGSGNTYWTAGTVGSDWSAGPGRAEWYEGNVNGTGV